MDHTSEFSPQGELYVSEPSHDRLLTSHSPLTTGCAATLFFAGGGLGLCLKDPATTPTPFVTRSLVFPLGPRFFNKMVRWDFFLSRKWADIVKREIKVQSERAVLFC